jgi:hypothetical protein
VGGLCDLVSGHEHRSLGEQEEKSRPFEEVSIFTGRLIGIGTPNPRESKFNNIILKYLKYEKK